MHELDRMYGFIFVFSHEIGRSRFWLHVTIDRTDLAHKHCVRILMQLGAGGHRMMHIIIRVEKVEKKRILADLPEPYGRKQWKNSSYCYHFLQFFPPASNNFCHFIFREPVEFYRRSSLSYWRSRILISILLSNFSCLELMSHRWK